MASQEVQYLGDRNETGDPGVEGNSPLLWETWMMSAVLGGKVNQHHEFALWAAACAEHVLALFEAVSRDDSRPRDAIDAAKRWQQSIRTHSSPA